jgi:twinkle protein
LSDIVLGLERNQQDPTNRNVTALRVLKNRFTGETGLCSHLQYDKQTGRMEEIILEDSELDEQDNDDTNPF